MHDITGPDNFHINYIHLCSTTKGDCFRCWKAVYPDDVAAIEEVHDDDGHTSGDNVFAPRGPAWPKPNFPKVWTSHKTWIWSQLDTRKRKYQVGGALCAPCGHIKVIRGVAESASAGLLLGLGLFVCTWVCVWVWVFRSGPDSRWCLRCWWSRWQQWHPGDFNVSTVMTTLSFLRIQSLHRETHSKLIF